MREGVKSGIRLVHVQALSTKLPNSDYISSPMSYNDSQRQLVNDYFQ